MNVQGERIISLCEALQLDRVAAEYSAIAQRAADKALSFSDFLEQLLRTELDGRHERARSTLLKLATLPAIRTLEDYDFGFAAGAPKAQVMELGSLAFVERMRPAEAVLTIKRRRISGRQARQRYSTARAR